jgi:type III pantothenate kinase
MILCLDCGNTRLKWGLRDGAGWAGQGVLSLARLDSLALRAERIVACNVAGEKAGAAIESLAARMAAPLHWVRAQAAYGGVTNGYEHPDQLGADRWAALIGARALHAGPALVVMSGTATTVDVLDADGVFRGGLILPGLTLMRESLAQGTADLPTTAGEFRPLPRNTFDAIASGCLNATLGAIERMFRQVADRPGALCLLAGGAAPTLAPHLAPPHRVVEDLVLEGLASLAAVP